MLVLWLGTLALAVFPELHHVLHHDSQSATHECIGTLLTKSQLLAGWAGGATVTLVFNLIGLRLLAEPSFCSTVDYRLSPSRAPPSVLPPIMVVG